MKELSFLYHQGMGCCPANFVDDIHTKGLVLFGYIRDCAIKHKGFNIVWPWNTRRDDITAVECWNLGIWHGQDLEFTNGTWGRDQKLGDNNQSWQPLWELSIAQVVIWIHLTCLGLIPVQLLKWWNPSCSWDERSKTLPRVWQHQVNVKPGSNRVVN